MTADFSLAPSEVEHIRVGGPAIMVTQHMLRRPVSVMAAQYGLPFSLGASLVHGPTEYEAYGEDKFEEPAILRLCDVVDAVEDAKMEAAFPEHFGSWVELRTKDGATSRSDVLDSIGTPARPMDTPAIRDKIAGLLASAVAAPDMEAVV